MQSILIFIALTLASPLLFAEPEIQDPKGLLKEISQFIANNRVPSCEAISEYDWAKCTTRCDDKNCQVQKCPMVNRDGVTGGISKFKVVTCNPSKVTIVLKPAFPNMGYQTWFTNDKFENAKIFIQTAMGSFLPYSDDKQCGFFAEKNVGKMDFWSSKMIIESLEPEILIMNNGQQVQTLKVSGSIDLPIRKIHPGCRSQTTNGKFTLWMAKDVTLVEQFVRFDFNGMTIFKITNLSSNSVTSN